MTTSYEKFLEIFAECRPFILLVAVGICIPIHVARKWKERDEAEINILHFFIGWIFLNAFAGFVVSHPVFLLMYMTFEIYHWEWVEL